MQRYIPNQVSLQAVLHEHTILKRDLGAGDLCDYRGFVAISAKRSYVTASPSHHDRAIPILSPLLFIHVGHPYIPQSTHARVVAIL